MSARAGLSDALNTGEVDRLVALAELLEARGLDYLELCAGGTTLSVARRPGTGPSRGAAAGPERAAALHAVPSPAVGTFHPLARPGSVVAEGAVVGHVHKLDDVLPVAAPRAGRVAEHCVPAGGFVEYGQALLRLAAP